MGNGIMKLFTEPFDLDAIERILSEDFRRFGNVAFSVLGLRENWDASLVQLSDLFEAFDKASRPITPLEKLFDLFVERALESFDTLDLLYTIGARFGFMVSERIKAAHAYRRDPFAVRQAENIRWLHNHHERYAAIRGAEWAKQANAALIAWKRAADETAAKGALP